MIKTAAFAPPRSASVPASRKPATRTASGRPNIKPEVPAEPAERTSRLATISVKEALPPKARAKARAREVLPQPAPEPPAANVRAKPSKRKAASSLEAEPVDDSRPEIIVTLTLPLFSPTAEPEPEAKPAPKAARKAKAASTPPESTPSAKAEAPVAKVAAKSPVEKAEAKAPKAVASPKSPVKKPAVASMETGTEAKLPAKRGRKSKIPDNLAEQYGQSVSKRAAQPAPPALEEETPKKRRTREEREKRRQLMAPDPGLLQRLARVHDMVGSAPAKRVSKPRGWEFLCGRCGMKTRFMTAGALCPKCGAIALREKG